MVVCVWRGGGWLLKAILIIILYALPFWSHNNELNITITLSVLNFMGCRLQGQPLDLLSSCHAGRFIYLLTELF